MASEVKQFVKNIGSGWLSIGVCGLVGMVILPLNLKYLGKELYGISCITTTFLNLFSFLSFGLSPTLLRFFSQAIVSKDTNKFKRLVSTALFILGSLFLVGASAFLLSFPKFVEFYAVPDSCRSDLWILFLALSLSFGEMLLMIPYFSIIQANSRFDLGNVNRIIAALLRLGVLWIGYVCFKPSLLILAASTFANTCYILVSISFLAWKLHGSSIFFHRKHVDFSLLPSLFSFSALAMISSVFFGLSIQFPILIVGKTLGKDMVPAFTPALTLAAALSSILGVVTVPLAPMASRDKINNGGKNLGNWAIYIGEVVACMGGCVIAGFLLLGEDFLSLWLGADMLWTNSIIVVTITGVVVATIQTTNYNMALGASSIAPVAYSSVVMAILTITGTYFGTRWGGWSLLGVACCITGVRVVRNTFYLAFIYSKLFHYNYWNYTWRVYCKPLLWAAVVYGIFSVVKTNLPAYGTSYVAVLIVLIVGAIAVSVVYGILSWYFILDDEIKKRMTFLKKLPSFAQKILRVK